MASVCAWWQGARRPFKSKGQGAFQYSSLRFEVNYPSFWCCLRFLWACYQFHTGSGAIVLTATGIQHCGLAKVRGSRSYVWSRWDFRDNVRWKFRWVQLISTMALDSPFQTRWDRGEWIHKTSWVFGEYLAERTLAALSTESLHVVRRVCICQSSPTRSWEAACVLHRRSEIGGFHPRRGLGAV